MYEPTDTVSSASSKSCSVIAGNAATMCSTPSATGTNLSAMAKDSEKQKGVTHKRKRDKNFKIAEYFALELPCDTKTVEPRSVRFQIKAAIQCLYFI